MSNSVIVKLFNGLCNIFDFGWSVSFCQSFILFEKCEEGSFFHVLQNEIDVLFIIEEPEDFENGSMIEETLDFKLQNELVYHEMGFDHLLGNLFDSKDGSSWPMDTSEDSSEFAFSKILFKDEITNNADFWLFEELLGRLYNWQVLFDFRRLYWSEFRT